MGQEAELGSKHFPNLQGSRASEDPVGSGGADWQRPGSRVVGGCGVLYAQPLCDYTAGPKAEGNMPPSPRSPRRSEAWEGHGRGCPALDLSEFWTSGAPPTRGPHWPWPPSLRPLLSAPSHQPGWEAHGERTSEQEVSIQVVPSPFSCGFFNPRGWVSEAFYSFSFTKLRSL